MEFRQNSILFTDEATFDLIPHLNRQNYRIWSSKRESPPSASSVTFKHFPKKNSVGRYRCEISKRTIFLWQDHQFRKLLRHAPSCIIPTLKEKRKFNSTIFQKNHLRSNSSHCRGRETTIEKSVWRGSNNYSEGFLFAWPGYSPDLTRADFGLWPTLKSRINAKNFEGI